MTGPANSARPEVCAYCNGLGYHADTINQHPCGFCDDGVPLDTQQDWDRTWGRVLGEDGSEVPSC